jgi:hypothetical protein
MLAKIATINNMALIGHITIAAGIAPSSRADFVALLARKYDK